METRHESETILIIEDDIEIRQFASLVLKMEGYAVLQAEDGDTGIELVREKQIALVLLDLRLPGRNGWSVLEEMKNIQELSAIPVIVFTATAEESCHKRTRVMGAADCIVKPISAGALVESVSRILHTKN